MVEKCCCFMSLNTGSLALGVFTLMLSVTLGLGSVVLLCLEHSTPSKGALQLKKLINLELSSDTTKIVFTCIGIIQLLWMLFSILLIVGVKKGRPSLLLGYFSFGVVMTILMMLSGLLVMLTEHWIMSLTQFISAAAYIHGLVVVYHSYELMQNNYVRFQDDENQLWNPEMDHEIMTTTASQAIN